MPINPDFVFSANSLQDYVDCPRRFELKYLLNQAWPAIESKPVLEFEHHLLLGNQFHQLVHQYLSGIPENVLNSSIVDADLAEWFRNFLEFFTPIKLERFFVEFSLRMAINQFQVVAVYDLIGNTKNGSLNIFDWKTAKHLPKRENLARRVQTILYPYLALECLGNYLPQFECPPEQVEMIYWFASHPKTNMIFKYDQEKHLSNEKFLTQLIAEIQSKEIGSFECTRDHHKCKYCVYRSLCERGKIAGDFNEMENEEDLDQVIEKIDFDKQDEIAF